MEFTRTKAKDNLAKLVEKLERESAAGKIKEYNEEWFINAKGSQKEQIQWAGRVVYHESST